MTLEVDAIPAVEVQYTLLEIEGFFSTKTTQVSEGSPDDLACHVEITDSMVPSSPLFDQEHLLDFGAIH